MNVHRRCAGFGRSSRDGLCAALLIAAASGQVLAQSAPTPASTPEATPAAAAEATAAPAAATQGILPIPTYAGSIADRKYLTGDWGGARSDLAARGIQVDVDFTQTAQSVVDGGRDVGARYNGTLDYNINFDLMRMNVLPGALIKFRAESKYGRTVNGNSGAILPVNADGYFPLTSSPDEDIPVTITDLTYIQFLSEKFGVLIGKFDTLDADPNEFASGRGTSQFLNANFLFNPAVALVAPYSTLGGGLIWKPTSKLTVSSLMYNSIDSSTSSGFEDVGDGTSWCTEVQYQYQLGSLPGGQNVGFIYSFDNDFLQLGGRFTFEPGVGLDVPEESDTWAAFWSGWQYLYTEETGDAPIDVTNGTPDRQGVGLFARFGFADEDTNPVAWSISGGVGGRGLIPSRDNDTFGVGYFHSSIQEGRLSGVTNLNDHSAGFEAYYGLAITPAAVLSFDAQIIDSISSDLDNSIVLGMRLGIQF